MSIKLAIAKKKLDTPLPIFLSGYGARKEYAKSIHDDLYANSLVITDGTKSFAIVSCDLLGIYAGYYQPIVDDIKKRVQIPNLEIVITCVHSHSSPALRDSEYDQNIDKMIEEVKVKITEGIKEAFKNAVDTKIGFNEMPVTGVGANRRDSKISVNTVLKLLLFKQTDKTGVAVNFNCHPTLMGPTNMQVSRDFQGYTMDKLVQDNYLPMYLQSACGDVSTRFTRTEQSFSECDRIGNLLAKAVEELAAKTEFIDVDGFNYHQHIITLPRKHYQSDTYYQAKIKEYRQQLEDKRGKVSASELRIFETALQGIEVEYRYSKSQDTIVTEIPCGILQLGKATMIFSPFEIFTKIADRIYDQSKSAITYLVGYSFDGQGYMPDKDSFNNGGYEVLSCRYAQGAGEILADKIIELINK